MKLFSAFILLVLSVLFSRSFSQSYDYYTPEEDETEETTVPIQVLGKDTLILDSLNLDYSLAEDSIRLDSLNKDSLIAPIFIKVLINNEDELKGELLSLDSTQIKLRTSFADLILQRNQITFFSLIPKPSEIEEKIKFDTPQQANYFFGPTAIPQTKKRLLYRNVLVLLNSFEYGLTKNISFDLGIDLSSFGGNSLRMTSGIKAGFKIVENVHAGLGLRITSDNDNANFGLAYGLITLGNNETNLTVGSGYGIKDKDFFKKVYFITSGVWRLGLNLSLISENYYSPLGGNDFVYFGSYGLRAIFKQNSSVDLGFMYFDNFNIAGGFVPLIGYSKKF